LNTTIRFGTDGWRGIIAEDFTFENVRAVAQALADYLDETSDDKQLAIGYDFRFFSEDFAQTVAKVLAANGVTVYLSPTACPTPHVSYFVHKHNLPLGVVITASHNPYHYNGIKIKERFGGSASPETTAKVESLIGKTPPRIMSLREAKTAGKIIETPLDDGYEYYIESLIDISAIRASAQNVVVDSMNGVGRKLLERWAASSTCRVNTLRPDRDPLFSGRAPEPKEEYLDILRDAVLAEKATLGLATDGDADRSGGVHRDGSLFTPLEMIALLALYLIEHRGQQGTLVGNNANTLYLRRIAEANGLPYVNKPVGFKHIAELMRTENVLIGGEESGGIAFQGFLPERDGVLVNLLLLEMVVKRGKDTLELLQELYERFGEYHFRRRDFPVSSEKGKAQVRAIAERSPKSLCSLAVEEVDTMDGAKLRLSDGSWILFRPSGTEPILRVYCEASSRELVDELILNGMKALGEAAK
jgi:phosphomannomutase